MTLFSSIVMFVPACKISCFPLTCVCNEDKPLPISTLFIIALLAIIEPLAKILPATSNASVAVEFSPILNPLSVILLYEFKLVPVEEIVLFEILIFVPAINVD